MEFARGRVLYRDSFLQIKISPFHHKDFSVGVIISYEDDKIDDDKPYIAKVVSVHLALERLSLYLLHCRFSECHVLVDSRNSAIDAFSTSTAHLVSEKVFTHLIYEYYSVINLAPTHDIKICACSTLGDVSETEAAYLDKEELLWALHTKDPLIKELLHDQLRDIENYKSRAAICDMRNQLLPPEYAFSHTSSEYSNCCVQRILNSKVQFLRKWEPEPSIMYSGGVLHTKQVPMYAEAYYDGVSPKFAKLLKERSRRDDIFSILIATSSDSQGGYVAVCIIEPTVPDEYHCILVDIWKQSMWDQYYCRISRAIVVAGGRPIVKRSWIPGMKDRALKELSDSPNSLRTDLKSLKISTGSSKEYKLEVLYDNNTRRALHVDKLNTLHISKLRSHSGSHILLEPSTEPSHTDALFWTVYAWARHNEGNFATFDDLLHLDFEREDLIMQFTLGKGYKNWPRILVKIEPLGIYYTHSFSTGNLKWELLSRTTGELKADVSEAFRDHYARLTRMSEHIPDYITFISSAANGDVSLQDAENLPSDALSIFELLHDKYMYLRTNRKKIWKECMATIIQAASEDVTVRSKFSSQGLCYLALEHTGSLSVPVHADSGSLSERSWVIVFTRPCWQNLRRYRIPRVLKLYDTGDNTLHLL